MCNHQLYLKMNVQYHEFMIDDSDVQTAISFYV